MTMMGKHGNSDEDQTTNGLTKVFVGGLAWETPKEAMRDHFHKYGEIIEAVIISDKLTGRSKGYGFVTFKDAEAAKKACEDPTPIINGRRANCNLAALGARCPTRCSSNPPPSSQGVKYIVGVRSPPPSHVQWYYPPFQHHHQPPAMPFYGGSYSPTYITASDIGYNHVQKLGLMNYGGQVYHHQQYYAGVGNNNNNNNNNNITGAVMPVYPVYLHYSSQAMGVPVVPPAQAHCYSPSPSQYLFPPLLPKPYSPISNPGNTAVGQQS